VARQFALAPELHQLLLDWGYEQNGDWLSALPKLKLEDNAGLIVGEERFGEIAPSAEDLALSFELASSWLGDEHAAFTTRSGEVRPEVIWLNDTAGAADFLNAWRQARCEHKGAGSVEVLHKALEMRHGDERQISLQHLPPSMCRGIEGDLPSPSIDTFIVARP
jgi:hypothetical protein